MSIAEQFKHTRTVVSYCSGAMVHSAFAIAMVEAVAHAAVNGLDVGWMNIRTTTLEVGRIRQIVEARRRKCTHILMVDSDMVFPAHVLPALLRHRKQIVGCSYSQRISPRRLTHEGLDGSRDLTVSDPLFEVKSLGLGCMLIDLSIFDRIPRPWFSVEFLDELDPHGVEYCRSEDRKFCDKARSAGFDVWCDGPLSLQLEHLGEFGFKMEHTEVPFHYL